MNDLLKQQGSDIDKGLVKLFGDKIRDKKPIHIGYRGNKGFFRNPNHTEKLRAKTHEEDDVQ